MIVSVMLLAFGTAQDSTVAAMPLFASAGPSYAGNAQAVASWITPGNSTGAPDSSCSESSDPGGAIDLTNFGFSIPAGSTITGILVEPKAAVSLGDSPSRIYSGTKAHAPKANETAQLLKAGSPAGTANASWAPVGGLCPNTAFLSLGGAGNTWGTAWTASDINNSNFGVRITDSAGAGPVFLDAVRITVFYDPAATATPPRPAEVPEADTLLLFGSGLGGLATWVGWQMRKVRAMK